MAFSPDTTKEKKKNINQTMLLCCKLYISESRNKEVLDSIERAAKQQPETVIVKKFEDGAYNRVSPLHQTVVAMAEAAFAAINLELHSGTHPRLGVVDDIIFHPLGRASLDEAAWLAKTVAADFGNRFQVPVFLYDAAHPTGKALAIIRREQGYFRPNVMGTHWAGLIKPANYSERPDEGPSTISGARGVTAIGASPWIAAYNVPILSTDFSVTRRIAQKVSGRGGGLPTVQTVGLVHGEDTTEIACLLLDVNKVGADRVQNRVEMLANQEGLEVEQGYFTDLSPEMVIEIYKKSISANSD
ncbi:Formimidoyltransferase-cyclodeaminase [Heracleum sosnowskyi]|uniref:glutamate formimidoyltransferase n=1 Tax=Heracleum sosnowskyi TaxID=360622 RepID=A0AAD8J073_9APIA|nr:Formimidoyltransferase-cyclodeaminase [Heracleum sosnowskyi]